MKLDIQSSQRNIVLGPMIPGGLSLSTLNSKKNENPYININDGAISSKRSALN